MPWCGEALEAGDGIPKHDYERRTPKARRNEHAAAARRVPVVVQNPSPAGIPYRDSLGDAL